jgi:hypothetical protein
MGSPIVFELVLVCESYHFDFKAQAAWLRSCNRTPPAFFENCFACLRMPAPLLGTSPEDVPYARTVVRGRKII